jgi:hypothetical protein
MSPPVISRSASTRLTSSWYAYSASRMNRERSTHTARRSSSAARSMRLSITWAMFCRFRAYARPVSFLKPHITIPNPPTPSRRCPVKDDSEIGVADALTCETTAQR